jgi:peptide deformylase
MKILQKTNKKLRVTSEPVVGKITSDVRKLAVDLKRALLASGNGVGIAAIQLGIPIRMIAVAIDSIKKPTIMINPDILEFSSEQVVGEEGCLSVAGEFGLVKRAKGVTVEFKTLMGEVVRMKCEGFTARCIQHEVDHLDGILFIDKMEK